MRNGNGAASFLHSREGRTQGDPLAIIAYGIVILPFIKNLKREIPDANHPWYADNAGALCTFEKIDTCFNFLARQGPGRVYYPEPFKSVLIVHPENLKVEKVFGVRHGFRVCMGAHYIRGYIGMMSPRAIV